MAGSRSHKLGSIYERLTGLLVSGVYKRVDTPIWYHVYEHHPPKYNPRFDRKAPDTAVMDILYEEDVIRAKIHKVAPPRYVDLNSNKQTSYTKYCIKSCQNLMKKEGISVDEAIKIIALSNEHNPTKAYEGKQDSDANI